MPDKVKIPDTFDMKKSLTFNTRCQIKLPDREGEATVLQSEVLPLLFFRHML